MAVKYVYINVADHNTLMDMVDIFSKEGFTLKRKFLYFRPMINAPVIMVNKDNAAKSANYLLSLLKKSSDVQILEVFRNNSAFWVLEKE